MIIFSYVNPVRIERPDTRRAGRLDGGSEPGQHRGMRSMLLASAILFTACSSARPPAAVPLERPRGGADELDALLEAFFDESLVFNPIRATMIQDGRYDYLMTNYLSPTMRVAGLAFDRSWLDRVRRSIDRDALEGQARLSYDVFVRQREHSIAETEFPNELLPISQTFNLPSLVAQLGSGDLIQPFDTVKNYEDWLVRLDQLVVVFDQSIINMRIGVERGIVQPKIVMEKVLPQIEAHVVDDVEQSVFWRPITNMPKGFSDADRARLTAAYRQRIQHVVIPAYRRVHAYVKDEYLPHTRDTVGLWALPNGRAWYAFAVREMTTTDATPAEIHRIGLEEVARIHEEIRGVMEQVGFEGDLDAWFAHVAKDPAQVYADEAAALEAFRALQARVNARLPDLFDLAPKADYEVRPVEAYRAASASGASYVPGSPDGSRPGVFYLNTADLTRIPVYETESLSLHEASPGHHFQLSIQQEIEALPKFRRFGGYTAYVEGWGLYAESLGEELGLYTDPMQRYGQLTAELLRALRLVVDTGLHHEEWSRQRAIDYMLENSSMAEAEVVPEVDRYIADPGQALAYKMGQRAISAMRRRAEEALGDAFDIRAFHRAILVDGALPLDVLAEKMDAWVEARR